MWILLPVLGVWVGRGVRKIAAIGISVRGGITSHGLALNCNTDLRWFHEVNMINEVFWEFREHFSLVDLRYKFVDCFS